MTVDYLLVFVDQIGGDTEWILFRRNRSLASSCSVMKRSSGPELTRLPLLTGAAFELALAASFARNAWRALTVKIWGNTPNKSCALVRTQSARPRFFGNQLETMMMI